MFLGSVIGAAGAQQGGDLSGAGWLGVAVMLLSPVLAALIVWQRWRSAVRVSNSESLRLRREVGLHRAALRRNLDLAIQRNDYGAVTLDQSAQVLDEFFSSINLDEKALARPEAARVVKAEIDAFRNQEANKQFDPDALPLDGHAFEYWVAEALERFGWSAQVTTGSGDQGIDVIALRPDGYRLGIQCKLYSGSVGNKAVQEANAGRLFYGLDAAAVLTNAPYTPSARELAKRAQVLLLSQYDIPSLISTSSDLREMA